MPPYFVVVAAIPLEESDVVPDAFGCQKLIGQRPTSQRGFSQKNACFPHEKQLLYMSAQTPETGKKNFKTAKSPEFPTSSSP